MRQTGGRDLNTTGFELKSIGDSEARGNKPVSFKEPPPLRGGSKQPMAKDAPTAENLKRLNTKNISTGARSDQGAKSARSARSHYSGKSGGEKEPEKPYANHTVIMMDALIQQTTQQIYKLANQKRNMENDPLATKTTIKAKVKPLEDEMKALRWTLTEMEMVREEKIPDHEKLPKDCVFVRHYLQVQANKDIEDVAKEQIKDDKEML